MSTMNCSHKRVCARSLLRKHPVLGAAAVVVTAAAVVGIIAALPDLVRYVKMSRM